MDEENRGSRDPRDIKFSWRDLFSKRKSREYTDVLGESEAAQRFRIPTAVEVELLHNEITSIEKLRRYYESSGRIDDRDSTNELNLVTFSNGRQAIAKPARGEAKQVYRVPAGSYYRRETAAYKVDKALGWDLVPTTVIREVGGAISSVQDLIDGKTMLSREIKDSHEWDSELFKIWIFTRLIGNTDQSEKHVVFNGRKVKSIDNCLAFVNDVSRVRDVKAFWNTPVPHEITDALRNVCQDLSLQNALKTDLLALLPQDEVDALFSRLNRITRAIEKEGMIKDKSILEKFK